MQRIIAQLSLGLDCQWRNSVSVTWGLGQSLVGTADVWGSIPSLEGKLQSLAWFTCTSQHSPLPPLNLPPPKSNHRSAFPFVGQSPWPALCTQQFLGVAQSSGGSQEQSQGPPEKHSKAVPNSAIPALCLLMHSEALLRWAVSTQVYWAFGLHQCIVHFRWGWLVFSFLPPYIPHLL